MRDSSAKVRYIKPVAIALSLLVLLALFGLSRGVRADGDLNPSKVVLHFLYEKDRSITGDMPADYISSYQIKLDGLSGTPSFKVTGDRTIAVSKNGLVTIKNFGDSTTLRYIPGTSVVHVTCGDYSQDIIMGIGYKYAGANKNGV